MLLECFCWESNLLCLHIVFNIQMILYEKFVEAQHPRLWGFFKRNECPAALVISNICLFLKESCKYTGASASGAVFGEKTFLVLTALPDHLVLTPIC